MNFFGPRSDIHMCRFEKEKLYSGSTLFNKNT